MTSTFTRTPRTHAEERRNRAKNPRVRFDTALLASETSATNPALTRITDAASPVTIYAARLSLTGAVTYWGISLTDIRVAPGEQLTLSAYGRPSVAATTVAIVQWLLDGVYVSQTLGTAAAQGANTWARRDVTATAPAGVNGARVLFRCTTSGASGNTLDVTGFLAELGAVLGTFFTGATANGIPPGWAYWWDAAADASESIGGPENPADITEPIQVNGYQASRPARTVAQQIANSSEVAVTVIPAGPRSGSLELLYDDPVDAMAAETLFASGSLFVFADTDVPEVGMTFAPADGDVGTEQDDTREAWLVTVPFVEVL